MRTGLVRAGWLPVLLFGLALWVAWSEFFFLRADAAGSASAPTDPILHLQQIAAAQPWGGLAGREAARELEARWRVDPPAAAEALDWQLSRYPLDAWRWLLSARIQGELERAATVASDPAHSVGGVTPGLPRSAIDIGVAQAVHPRNRAMQWQAVNLAQSFGDADLIAKQLRLWLHDQPQAVDRALFLVRRWLPDPDQRLDRVLPEGEAFLIEAMRHARTSRQPQLGPAVWARLPQPRPAEDSALADYVRIVMDHDDPGLIMALWADLDPHYAPGRLPGGHFGASLAALDAMGWDLRMPVGAQLTLDEALPPPEEATTGPGNSLRLDFDGRENVNLSRPTIRFPVPEPGRYRLSGWWQAEGLTTRTLPTIIVRADPGSNLRIEPPRQSFPWTRFEAEVTVEPDGGTVMLQLRRPATQRFDRNLAGSLWLADLRFELIEESAP